MAAKCKRGTSEKGLWTGRSGEAYKKYVNRADGKGVGTGDPAGASNGSYPGTVSHGWRYRQSIIPLLLQSVPPCPL